MPNDWNLITVGKLAKVEGGYAFKSNDYVDQGVRLIRITNVSFGFIDLEDTIRLPHSFIQKYPQFSLGEGDIVLVLTRPITEDGIKAAKMQRKHLPALLNQRVGKIVMRENNKLDRDSILHPIFRTVY
jgi:type I restriction enzyme, S subunit